MNRYERLLEDVLIFENDPLRLFVRDANTNLLQNTCSPILDTVGDWFIGFGTSWLHGEKVTEQTESITYRHALDCAESELWRCMQQAPDLVENWPAISHVRQNVLTLLIYQIGKRGAGKFKKMITAINNEDYEEAAAQLLDSKLAKQTPRRTVCIAKRLSSNQWLSF